MGFLETLAQADWTRGVRMWILVAAALAAWEAAYLLIAPGSAQPKEPMMYARFMALPFFTRRIIIVMASFFVMWVCAYLPKSGFTQVVIGSSAFIMCWATGILVPFLKITFFVLRWRLWYVVRYK